MSDERFNRLEDKVDKVDDKVDKVALEVVEMRTETKHQMETIKSHVTQDEKIVNHIKPLLPILEDLADMVEDHKFEKKAKLNRSDMFKKWSIRIGAVTATLGLLSATSAYGKQFLLAFARLF